VLVTNEAAMSIHPATEVGRAFVELAGFAHQRLAAAANEVYFAVMGVVIKMDLVIDRRSGTSL
jgi:adenosylcobinamide kinase/adenosylcobinamide-phosphate guanylyltransferase